MKYLLSEEQLLDLLEDYDREFKLDTFAYKDPPSFTVKEWFNKSKKKLNSSLDKTLNDVMNLGMSCRQTQLQGYCDKSGNEILEEWKKENL